MLINTGDTLVIYIEIRLEVLAARLGYGVNRCYQQRTILPPIRAATGVDHVTGDVSIAPERVRVLGSDAATGGQTTIKSSFHNDHVTRIAGRAERLRGTKNFYNDTTKNSEKDDSTCQCISFVLCSR